MSSFVEEILGLVEIFLVAGDEIEFRQVNFRYLMPRYACHLAWIVADFAADAVGIFDGYVEEVAFALWPDSGRWLPPPCARGCRTHG